MWQISLFILLRMYFSYLTLCNTSSFFTRSINMCWINSPRKQRTKNVISVLFISPHFYRRSCYVFALLIFVVLLILLNGVEASEESQSSTLCCDEVAVLLWSTALSQLLSQKRCCQLPRTPEEKGFRQYYHLYVNCTPNTKTSNRL